MRAAIVTLALTAALVLTAGAAATNDATAYGDAAGDSGEAPDVTSVEVSHSDTGDIRFVITIANRGRSLNFDEAVGLFLDTDGDVGTGAGPLGTEYLVVLGALRYVSLGRFVSAEEVVEVPDAKLFISLDSPWNVSFNRSELGVRERLNFHVFAFGNAYEDADFAPEEGTFSYSLAPPIIRSLRPAWSPAKPRAGKAFALSRMQVALSNGKVAAASSYRCTAKLRGKTLRPAGKCRWLLSKAAEGQKLVITVVASSGALAKTSTYVFRVG